MPLISHHDCSKTFGYSNIGCESNASDFSEKVLISQTIFACSNLGCESIASDFSDMMFGLLKKTFACSNIACKSSAFHLSEKIL